MIGGQSINILYVLGIIYALYSILSSVNKKKRLGEIVLDIDNIKAKTRIVVVVILTILISYMIYLSFSGYSTHAEQATVNTGVLINFILEVLFWLAIYASLIYAQFGKRYIGKEGLSMGTRAYTWNEIKQYSWKDNQLAITVDERFFSNIKEKGHILNIPMDKVEDTSDILRVKVKGKGKRAK